MVEKAHFDLDFEVSVLFPPGSQEDMTTTLPDVAASYSETAGYQRVLLELAACRGESSDIFFSPSARAQAAAKRVCARCEVRWECLFYALETRQQHGVWGGLTAEQRMLLRRQIARELAS